ncbi:MAG: glycosyltransferase, partial [Pseudomonadota bacterium]|nr:glycosyltransferase [Pseudomonadota bacterium]
MKVVQFVPNLNSGGVERGTLEIAQALVNAGHESHVVSNGGRMVDELTAQGSTHHQWALHRKSLTTLLEAAALRRWLEDLRPDIIHVRSRMPAWVVWLAWRKMNPAKRPRLVTTLHGLHSVSWYSKIMGRGERVIAVSKTAEQYLRDHCGVLPHKIRLIYRGTDPSAFPRNYQPSEQWLKAWAIQFPHLQGKRLICLPGRISRLKAHHHLITSLQRLKAEGITDVAGLIVGGKDAAHEAYFRELQAQVIKAGVAEDIVFAG